MVYKNLFLLLLLFVVAMCGCGSSNVEVIDLNKVLDVFQATLTELDGDKPEAVAATELEVVEKEESEKKDLFLTTLHTNLNAANLLTTPIGVEMHESGTVNGFSDRDSNNKRGSGENELFKIEIDEAGKRLVASDGGGHYRDQHYRPHFGFFTGYMIGSMMSRNRSYYSGSRSGMRPNYGKTTMSPKSYHSNAVAKARSSRSSSGRSSSSRSKSGSRGFSFGK